MCENQKQGCPTFRRIVLHHDATQVLLTGIRKKKEKEREKWLAG
jgi:hypothetical protein